MGAGGSIPADEAAAKEAGKTDEEILIYKASQGFKDGSLRALCTDDAEMAYPGAPPFPIDMAMSMTTMVGKSFPDWKSLCLSITKNDDGTYTTLEQQLVGEMKVDLPAFEGTPFPEVKVAEIPEESKIAMVFPVEVTTYTLEGDKIKKCESNGETKEASEVEGANADVTPYMKEQWAAGKGGFPAIYSFFGKPLPAPPAFDDMDADGDGELTAEASRRSSPRPTPTGTARYPSRSGKRRPPRTRASCQQPGSPRSRRFRRYRYPPAHVLTTKTIITSAAAAPTAARPSVLSGTFHQQPSCAPAAAGPSRARR